MKKALFTASLVLLLSGCGNTDTPTNSDVLEKTPTTPEEILGKCLLEKGAIMYGTTWCGHCKHQKELFKTGVEFLPFVDCEKEKGACKKAGITGYPTWKFADNSTLIGSQDLNVLAKKTGCTY